MQALSSVNDVQVEVSERTFCRLVSRRRRLDFLTQAVIRIESWKVSILRQVTASGDLFTGGSSRVWSPEAKTSKSFSSDGSFVELNCFCAVPDDGFTEMVRVLPLWLLSVGL